MSPRPVFKSNDLPPLSILNPAHMIEHEFKQCQPKLNHFNPQHDLVDINYQNHCAPVFSNPAPMGRKQGMGIQQQYQNFQQRHHAHFENVSPLSVESKVSDFCPFPGGIACDVSVSDNTPLETPPCHLSLQHHVTLSAHQQDEVMSPDFYFHHNSTLSSMMPEKRSPDKPVFTYKVAFSDHTRDCTLGFRLNPSHVKIGDAVSVSATRGQESLGVVVEIASSVVSTVSENVNGKRDPFTGRILRLATPSEVNQMRGVQQAQQGGVEGGGAMMGDFSHIVY
eukprot:gene31554-38973_t